MDITLQYFSDCPNWKTTDAHLTALVTKHGVDAAVQHQLIETHETAVELGFRGSPTVLVDGVDPFADPNAPVGLTCRIYPTGDGAAGSPTLDQLQEAIAARQHGVS